MRMLKESTMESPATHLYRLSAGLLSDASGLDRSQQRPAASISGGGILTCVPLSNRTGSLAGNLAAKVNSTAMSQETVCQDRPGDQELVAILSQRMRDNPEEVQSALQDMVVLQDPTLLLDAVKVCQHTISPEKSGLFQELCSYYNLDSALQDSDLQPGADVPFASDVGGAPLHATSQHTAHSLRPSPPLAASNDDHARLKAYDNSLGAFGMPSLLSQQQTSLPLSGGEVGSLPSGNSADETSLSFDRFTCGIVGGEERQLPIHMQDAASLGSLGLGWELQTRALGPWLAKV
ncbi:hypothetical protein WJX77_008931 [Trebouxia sp. C0004]